MKLRATYGLSAALLGATALTGVAPAFAQVEVITVTAQKREETLTDVPVAVTAVTGASIERTANYSLETIQKLVPSLSFRKGTTTRNSALILRGVGTISFSVAAEPAVATVVDGVVLARSGQSFSDLYDVERVEVLRGPQGTLFGKNASAGVINIVTKSPSEDPETEIGVAAFEGGEYRVKASTSGALNPAMRGRLTGFYGSFDGPHTNVFDGEKINGYERYGVRGVLDWDLGADVTARLIADYAEADDNCCGELIGTTPNDALVLANLGAATPLGDETRAVNHNLTASTQDTTYGVSGEFNWGLGDHTVTSITAYRSWENREIRDGDWQPGFTTSGIELHDDGPQETTQFSQELRLTSPGGEKFDYVAGLFLWNVETDRQFTRDVFGCLDADAVTPGVQAGACTPATSVTSFLTGTADINTEIRNAAIFGQGTYALNDEWKLIGGLRATYDEVSFTHSRVANPATGGPGVRPANASGLVSNETDNTGFSGKLGAQWFPNEDVMAYATYSRGYKGPAFNVFFNLTEGRDDLPIEEETSNSFEVGLKATSPDNRVQMNAAMFYAEYSDFQANNFDTVAGQVVTRLTNAGDVRTQGFELDALWTPNDAWDFTAAVAYTDAEVTDFNVAGVGATVASGTPLPLVPEIKTSLGARYSQETSSRLPFNIEYDANLVYQTETSSDFSGNPALDIGSYGILDLGLTLVDKADRYEVGFVVKNATDQSYASLITTGGPAGSLRYLIPRDADRYIGVQAKMRLQ